MNRQEIPIVPGISITEYGKNAQLLGIHQPEQPQTKDVGMLLEECHNLDSKMKKLQDTIQEIKKEKKWEQDQTYRQAIEQNWNTIIKFCDDLKQKVIRLDELKYKPATTKIQELMNVDRIQKTKAHAKSQLDQIKIQRYQKLEKEKQKQQEEQDEYEQGMYI